MSAPVDPLPKTLGDYVLRGEIAHGGMAEVQYAVHRDRPQGPMLAAKTILRQYAKDSNFRRFFAAEVDLTRSFHHANIVSVIDSGEAEGVPYLVMEHIHGRALNRLLHALAPSGKRLPIPFASYIAMKALEGLEHAHSAIDASGRPLQVVMCDISPSNIMVGYRGDVKLIDFGIATSRMKFFEQIGMLKGKKNYMAPEQLQSSPLDHRADIFAMGIVVHELVTGQSLFGGRTEFEVEQLLRSGKMPLLRERVPTVPEPLEALVSRALAPKPEDRFQSAAELARALEPFARMGKGSPIGPADLAKILPLYAGALEKEDDERLARAFAGQSGPAETDSPAVAPSTSPLIDPRRPSK